MTLEPLGEEEIARLADLLHAAGDPFAESKALFLAADLASARALLEQLEDEAK